MRGGALMPNSRFVGVLTCLLVCASWLYGQRADRATISGLVTDPGGSSVPNATVRIRNDNTGVETVLTANEAGLYTSPLLTLGMYTVSVEHAGFKLGVR